MIKKKYIKNRDQRIPKTLSFFPPRSHFFPHLLIMSEKLEHEKAADIIAYEETDLHEEEHDRPEPTEQDWKELRQVADELPFSAFLILIIEFCERFTYYGLSGPFQNYIQNPAPPSCKY